jgi:hypothetical protein
MTGVITGILTDKTLRDEHAVEALLLSEANIALAWS